MSRFIAVDRETAYLLPPSVDDWLPQNHLARFVVEVIEQLDLSELIRQYAGRGSNAYLPPMLLGLLVYGYAGGVHSTRKIERACHDSVAFRFMAANTQPDHDSIATFRRRFLAQIAALFVQVLMLAREMKCLQVGHIAPLDGTKIAANASKHRVLSWENANRIEAQPREEVQLLLKLAEDSDSRPINDDLDVPAEIARREQRLGVIAQAKAKMVHRLGAKKGRLLLYGLRKQTVEPVFGIIKRVMGRSQMSMPGLAQARGDWSLVTMAWNIMRLLVLRAA
jgi:transposase